MSELVPIETDDTIRHEAGLLFANNESRTAIQNLIQRINNTQGNCSPQIWLMLLDIYKTQGQQAPYEKLASFFSTRFQYSPPSWEIGTEIQKNNAPTQWRNALIVEGSVLEIADFKMKDYIKASKDAKTTRLDLSRMRIDPDERIARQELEKLLIILERLSRHKVQTLLMGEIALMTFLKNRIQKKYTDLTQEKVYWDVLFTLLQWRGLDQEYDQYAQLFTDIFEYCPIGYDPSLVIATSPHEEREEPQKSLDVEMYVLPDTIEHIDELIRFAEAKWKKKEPVELSLHKVKRITSDAARELAQYLATQTDLDSLTSSDLIFKDVNETIVSLFETTGVSSYAQVQSKHHKLRSLLKK